jgi:tetratricopeptide (TPR) repeat protein
MKSILLIAFLMGTSLAFSQETDETLSVYLQNAQYQNAIEYIEKQEAGKDLLYQKAFCYKSLNNYSKAIAILEALSEEYPEDIRIKLQLALSYESVSLYPESIACYEKLIQMDSTNTYFQVRKADLLYCAGKYSTALEEYGKISPDYNPGYLKKSVAMCYEKINQVDSAGFYFAEAWKSDPKDAFSALSLVKLHIKQDDFVSALNDSEKFISQDTTNMQMNILNAFTYYKMDAYEEAVQGFEKCKAQGDSSLIVNRGLGISYFFLKNDSKALPCLIQAYAQDTTNMIVLYALASANYNLEKYPEAVGYYSMLVERAAPNRNALYTYYKGLGMACEKDCLFQNAYSNYMAALQYATSFQSMELYYLIAQICENELKDYSIVNYYYERYKLSLNDYTYFLKNEETGNAVLIKEMEEKIRALENHIQSLKKEHQIN